MTRLTWRSVAFRLEVDPTDIISSLNLLSIGSWLLDVGRFDGCFYFMLNNFAVLMVVLAAFGAQAADDYKLGPDSQFKADVPHGRVERFQITNSTVFPGTVRDGGVYIPAQYDPSKPAALMVF